MNPIPKAWHPTLRVSPVTSGYTTTHIRGVRWSSVYRVDPSSYSCGDFAEVYIMVYFSHSGHSDSVKYLIDYEGLTLPELEIKRDKVLTDMLAHMSPTNNED